LEAGRLRKARLESVAIYQAHEADDPICPGPCLRTSRARSARRLCTTLGPGKTTEMAKMETARSGGCLCGAVRYVVAGEPRKIAICHCRMCQRWSGGPFASAAEFPADDVEWKEEPSLFCSSDSISRAFCSTCGSSLGFKSANGTIWITLGTLDRPKQLKPQFHIFVDEELPWARLNDGVPHYGQFEPS
jgi:hypothetical protein